MKNTSFALSAIACSIMLPLATTSAYAGTWQISGFARGEYGNGSRYDRDEDEERFGITKAAVKVAHTHENLKGVVVAGTKGTYDGTTDGDMNIKAAFVKASNIAGSGVSISAGVQPLMFGLKPNGYKGDRSIHGSVEYGTGGGLPVARQAGTSIIANTKVGGVDLRGGFFKFRKSTSLALSNSGASIDDNYFVQAYAKDILSTGFYGVVGYESVFVNEDARSEAVTTLGLGWKNELIDISAERTTISEAISNTVGDENYTVLELAVKTSENTKVYADYSTTDKTNINTIRTGINYNYADYLMLSLEYSKDNYEDRPDVDSVDLRVTMSF